uniref:Putative secreted protein n=1 Tax=Amblyomma cajennense TaxID=34607 RepID=A0A023FQV3_AMBCJ
MFLNFVAAASVFFTVGLDISGSAELHDCRYPKTVVKGGKRPFSIGGHTDNCNCTFTNGTSGQYPDGTPCFDGERHIGKCTDGICKAAQSTYGCAGKNGTEPGSVVNNVTCTFDCKNEQGQTEWAFSPDGTPCVNKDDLDNIKNGTCKHRPLRDRKNETVCFPNDQMHLLGC